MVTLEREKVYVEPRRRDIGPPMARDNPVGQVIGRLEAIRHLLLRRYDAVAGAVFTYLGDEA